MIMDGTIARPRLRRSALIDRTTTVTTAATQPADLLTILRLLKGSDDFYLESVRQRALKGDYENDLRSDQQ